jgi:hypothetical protein
MQPRVVQERDRSPGVLVQPGLMYGVGCRSIQSLDGVANPFDVALGIGLASDQLALVTDP